MFMNRNIILKSLAFVFLAFLLLPAITTDQYNALDSTIIPLEERGTPAFTPKTILFDESHTGNGSSLWAPGNASMLSWMLGENGYSSSTNFNESLDSGILNNFDILVIFFPVIPLTSGEIADVQSFVDNGGGLLLVGADGSNWWKFRGTNLNPISTAYGVTFHTDSLDEVISTFNTHNITHQVTTYNTEGDDLRSCSLTVITPAITIVESSGGPVVAASESGLGRIVCAGGPGPFYMYRKNSGSWGASHFQFSLNVFDWLAGNPTRTVVVPEEAIITVGPGPSLSPTEVESYSIFTGAIHDHTTHSDGANTPREMLDKALRLGFDYFVMSDHSHSTPVSVGGITGAIAVKSIVDSNTLDLQVIIAAELSTVKHTLGFPLTANIFTADQQEGVDEIHAQGGIAGLCHPTIGFDYAPVYENRDAYGYDAIEVNNRGFFFGGGEDGFFDNFYGAADTHSAGEDGIENAIFVLNPSGPNGRVGDADIVDAILNKRVVILDPYNNMIYGQEIWVERYLELRSEAEAEIQSGLDQVETLSDAGEDVGLSSMYLEDAINAIEHFNPGRALRMAQNATSEVVLGLDLTLSEPDYLDPNTEYQAVITLKNNHTYPVEIDTSVFIRTGVSFALPDYTIAAAGESTTVSNREITSDNYGLVVYALNLYSFNTTKFVNPILIQMRGIVDNVTSAITEETEGYEVALTYWMGRASGGEIGSAVLHYNNGSGEEEVSMERGWDVFVYSLGPFEPGTELEISIVVTTHEGQVYTVGEDTLTLGTVVTNTPTTTDNTTTTTGGEPTPFDLTTLLMIVGGVGIGIVILLVVIVKFRK